MCDKRLAGYVFLVTYCLRHFKLHFFNIFFILLLIFVHPKMPEEHILKITQSLKTQGRFTIPDLLSKVTTLGLMMHFVLLMHYYKLGCFI